MSTFGNRLKKARLDKNLTQKQLGNLIGASNNSICNWEKDQNKPDVDTIELLCKELGLSPSYLIGGESGELPSNILPLKLKKIPLLGEISCGEPKYADEEFQYFVHSKFEIQADFCLRAKGDSMINARINDGDIVFIRQQSDVDDGEIAAVVIDDETTLKRVYKIPGRIQLRPENPVYKPIEFAGEETNRVRILGKAVFFQSAIR